MTGVGFEPTRTNTSELESDPLDHSGNQPGRANLPNNICEYFFKLFLYDFDYFLFFFYVCCLNLLGWRRWRSNDVRSCCVTFLENLALLGHELFFVLAAHDAWSRAHFFADCLILANLPEPRRVVLDFDLFVLVNPFREITQIFRVIHIFRKVDKDDPKFLPGVAVSL